MEVVVGRGRAGVRGGWVLRYGVVSRLVAGERRQRPRQRLNWCMTSVSIRTADECVLGARPEYQQLMARTRRFLPLPLSAQKIAANEAKIAAANDQGGRGRRRRRANRRTVG